MKHIEVDVNTLADDLEMGINKVGGWFADMPKDYRLRVSVCGLVSTGIDRRLKRLGIESQLVLNELKFDLAGDAKHVFPLINPDLANPLVIDASYSQFFSFVGLSYPYAAWSGQNVFPEQKILAFNISERGSMARWMAAVAVGFQKVNSHPKNDLGGDMGNGPLVKADVHTIEREYSKIWDLSSCEPWTPPAIVSEAGEVVADSIRESSIRVK